MPDTKDALISTTQQVVVVEFLLTLLAAGVAYAMRGVEFAIALAFGGLCTLMGTVVHAWMLKRATQTSDGQPTLNVAGFFQGILLKWIVMVGMLLTGIKLLQLTPSALVMGFAIAYIGFMFGRGAAIGAQVKPTNS